MILDTIRYILFVVQYMEPQLTIASVLSGVAYIFVFQQQFIEKLVMYCQHVR